ncbi:MAG: DNA polymerase IV [Bacteroidales bacterium]|nr:DNA polymerase IV [Bacteroidales bacterium]
MLRKIIHIDMDAFYASVEQRDNPELKGKPVAVGHSSKRGVVAAASYEARKYGVRSAMPSMRAKKLCPHLIFVPGRMQVYKEVSKEIHKIFRKYTNKIEPLSLDEAFLDVTQNKYDIPYAITIAKEIKESIKRNLDLTASAGVSYNKFLAKIASDLRKPDGLCTIHPEQAMEFIENLPIESFWGVGPVTAKKMHRLGIHKGIDLKLHSLESLVRHFGKSGQVYYDFSRGIDLRPVEPYRERKSVGCEKTLEKSITLQSSIIIELYHIAKELVYRVEKSQFKGNTLTLKVRFDDFSQITRSHTINHSLFELKEILQIAKRLLQTIEYKLPIRLMGLSVSNPIQEDELGAIWEQLSFEFSDWD